VAVEAVTHTAARESAQCRAFLLLGGSPAKEGRNKGRKEEGRKGERLLKKGRKIGYSRKEGREVIVGRKEGYCRKEGRDEERLW
jgi:hypothetical protein